MTPPFEIACRYLSYRPYLDEAWGEMRRVGVRAVELPLGDPSEVENLRRRATGFRVTSAQAPCDLERPDLLDFVAEALPAFHALGCPIWFAGVKCGGLSKAAACERLRAVGERLRPAGITLAIETHPDLAENADVALDTLGRVDHPNVRLNFDTGNIPFYNAGADPLRELERCVHVVAAVHLKDSSGRVGDRDFPALGAGVVPFREALALLADRGFAGPCTIETEPDPAVRDDRPRLLGAIEASVAHVRALGYLEAPTRHG